MTAAAGSRPPHARMVRDPASSRLFGLDLLRALAIVGVLASHAGGVFAAWGGGRLPHLVAVSGTFGVTLFFVLSGFLVGGILRRALREGGTLGRFLLRRWLRTVPLYWLAIAALASLDPPPHLLRDVVRYATFTQNLLPPQLDWFFPVSWTLAVEEWFYAGFAVLLFASAPLLGRAGAMGLALGLFLVGPPFARSILFVDPAEYRIVPFWLDCIGMGVLAAVVAGRAPAAFACAARPLLAPALALVAFFWCDETWRFVPAWPHRVFGFGAIAAALALLLPAAAGTRRPPRRALAAPVRWLSTRSYGIYITHVAVLDLVAPHRAAWGLAAAVAVALLGMAALPELTWRLVEQPCLRLRPAEHPARGSSSAQRIAMSNSTSGKPGET